MIIGQIWASSKAAASIAHQLQVQVQVQVQVISRLLPCAIARKNPSTGLTCARASEIKV